MARHSRRPKTPATPKRAPLEFGTERNGRVYVPGHTVAGQRGWASTHRLAAFNARNGVCVCDAGKQEMVWPAAKVVNVDGAVMVLCGTHGHLRWIAERIVSTGFGGAVGERLAFDLGALWTAPCPPEGVLGFTEEEDEQRVDPFGATPSDGLPPATQVEI